MGYIIGAWLPLIIWRQVDAPRYHKGFITATVASAAGILLVLVIKIWAQKDDVRCDALFRLPQGRAVSLTML